MTAAKNNINILWKKYHNHAKVFLVLLLVLFAFPFIHIEHDRQFLQERLHNENGIDRTVLVLQEHKVFAEVVNTQSSRQRGLSGREMLDSDAGMLFVFERSAKYSFWMKDMNFAIDIIWIDEDMKIVDMHKHVSPDTYPETFTPQEAAKYVLEVNAGWSDKKNARIDQEFSLEEVLDK